MKILIVEKIERIKKAKKLLEKILEVKITNRGKEVKLEGNAENEYIAEKVLDAINYGFPITHAIEIKEQEFLFEIINIKEFTKRKDYKNIRARLIGTNGKTLKVLSDLTGGYVELKDNEMALIAPPETIENLREAVISIVGGAKQSNVYKHLEKLRPTPIEDLGLKEEESKA